jgi:hypothetical protein
LPVFKCPLTTLHGPSYNFSDFWVINRTDAFKLTGSGIRDFKMTDQLRRSIDDDVRVVAGENYLALALRRVQLVCKLSNDAVVEVALRLVDDKWTAGLLKR